MQGRTRFTLSGVVALIALALGLALFGACATGASQTELDAARKQLAAKEQEAAGLRQQAQTAQQQVTSLQQQLKPAAPREPKRLEAKITVDMGETKPGEMFFATPAGQKGGPFTLPAGKTVGMHFVNKGEKLHEVMFGRTLKLERGEPHGYEVNLSEKVAADLFVYYPVSGKMVMVEIGGAEFEEIEVDPGAEVWIRAKFPAELKGEWEIGCFVQEPGEKGHYEQGMKAKLIIE